MVAHPDMQMMSYGVNLRYATVTPQAYEMWNQMIDDPSYFVERNLNITVYCDKAEFYEENGEQFVHIVFGKYGGVVNGGHTMATIIEAILMGIASPYARVRIFIREYNREVTSKEVATTCTALNSMKKQDDFGNGEVSGYHESFKHALEDYSETVEWKPNEKEYDPDDQIHCDAVDITCMAYVMAPNSNGSRTNKYVVGTNKNNFYKQYLNTKARGETHSCEKMLPIMRECYELVDYIYSNFHNVPKKYVSNFNFDDSDMLTPITKMPVKKKLPRLLLFPILAAMSENVKFNQKTGQISTYMDFVELYERSANDIWDKLNKLQKIHGDAGKYVFCNSKVSGATWDAMREVVKREITAYRAEKKVA